MRDLSYWLGEDGHSHRPPMDKRKPFREGTGSVYYGAKFKRVLDPPSSPILGVYDRFVDDLERAPGWVWLLLGLSALGLAAAIVGYAR